MVHRIAETRKHRISTPHVVHILWTETSQAMLQSSLEPPDSTSGTPSAPSTPEISQLVLPSSEPSGPDRSESFSSLTFQPTKASDTPVIRSSLEMSGTPEPSASSLAPRTPATRHAMATVIPASRKVQFNTLQKSRQDYVKQGLRDHDPSLEDQVINEIQDHIRKENFGKCAETIPYLCIVCGGLDHRQIYGLAFEPVKLKFPYAKDVLSASPFNPTESLDILHELGFKEACEICCILMRRINVQYIQYGRKKKTLQPYLLYPDGTEETLHHATSAPDGP
ncbi:hypothetical protein FS837_008848 [Tulasnella sp. UAMH 9824]|nr:hypothetical protein FS837_008848 [Tulasnella sp. UAMH 9824]